MKQKITKSLFLPLLIVGLSLSYLSAQNYLPAVQLAEENYCFTEKNLYLNEDNDTDGMPDYFMYLRSNFRYPATAANHSLCQIMQFSDPSITSGTRVYYWMSEPNVLQKQIGTTFGPIDNQTFKRMAQTFPYNQRVRGIDTNDIKVIFEKPITTGASTTVSILYNYKYRTSLGYANGTKTRRYNPVASGSDFHGLMPNELIQWTSNTDRVRTNVYPSNACVNYKLHRCGDGKIDTYNSTRSNTFTGEICDDGPNNGQPGYCNATCSSIGGEERCGDNIIQPAGTFYNGDSNNMSFEECDDGDLTGDNGDGLLNGDDIEANFCSSICLPLFAEEFTEEFVNE